eukprot:TRINITY_DN6744_c0_g1_i3.p1 TRINITY_DN6744_c0_g1~~TRINITY_DN6744_c0_g1_i3.p1  ORF type:complete len:108 (-),score=7.21 TRINITY_DN6744_c0_g1_i3:390-713(-)
MSPPIQLVSAPLPSMEEVMNWVPGVRDHSVSRVPLQSRLPSSRVKVIHCHDMAGNYLEDKYVNGGTSFHVYNFRHWNFVDIFVYFGHERVMIPRGTLLDRCCSQTWC